MSDHAAFRAAAAAAKAQAARQGLVITEMLFDATGHLSWEGIPKKAAKAAAQGPLEFEARKGRGLMQGTLI